MQTDRWKSLAAAGARPQRALWGSTSSKDPAYSDIKYVEDLIAPGTVNTMPLKTLEAFRDHGKAEPALTEGVEEAERQLAQASELSLESKCRRLKAA